MAVVFLKTVIDSKQNIMHAESIAHELYSHSFHKNKNIIIERTIRYSMHLQIYCNKQPITFTFQIWEFHHLLQPVWNCQLDKQDNDHV